jgi:hypothetical protein
MSEPRQRQLAVDRDLFDFLLASANFMLGVMESEPECAIYKAHMELARDAIRRSEGVLANEDKTQ